MVFLLATGTPGSANHLDEQDLNGVHLALLVYHPYPDAKGDPFGVPYEEQNRTADWMTLRYGAYWFPTAAFDGVTVLEQTPQGEGGGPFLETYANYDRAYRDRAQEDSPLVLRLEAEREPHALRAFLNVTSAARLEETGLHLRAALFEDDVFYEGGNGVRNHRFTVRTVPHSVRLERPDSVQASFEFPLEESWQPGRLGFVAWVQNEDEASRRFDDHEVLQAAVWKEGQVGPTVQHHKAVLMELYSAVWCEACPPGDAAADELANNYGLPSSRVTERAFVYLRAASPWVLGTGLVVGILGAAALRRRPPPPTAPPMNPFAVEP